LCEELHRLAPEATRELRSALQKIGSGQTQEEALADLATLTTAEGFREYLIITRQISQSGGGVDQALADLYQLLQHRRRTELQEKVSKLSAKMSVVMMLFLFPALLIVLGGPGFIAIGGALAHLGTR
jgi:tight adherence protein C